MPIDWGRVTFTDHMTEAAGLVGECQVVLDFGGGHRVQYEIKVYESLKGGGDDPFFALGSNPEARDGYRPFGGGASAEAAVETCLANAGVHHRRLVKQAGE